MPSDPTHVAHAVLTLLDSRTPTLGRGRLVCVDGPAGSGKTTIAAALAKQAREAVVVHTDDLLEGWRGLSGLGAAVERLLRPLAAEEQGRWTRWDWHAGRWAETRRVEPCELLVLEGTGSWSPGMSEYVTVLVWVETDSATRLARGLARDGEWLRSQWEQWQVDEEALFARLGTRDRADVRVVT